MKYNNLFIMVFICWIVIAIYVSPSLAETPSIDSMSLHNSKTGDGQTVISLNIEEQVHFHIFSDQATKYRWSVDGIPVDNNFHIFSMKWSEVGSHIVQVEVGNTEGWSAPIKWNVSILDMTATDRATRFYNPHSDTYFGTEFGSLGKNSFWVYGDNWIAFEITPQEDINLNSIGVMVAEEFGILPIYQLRFENIDGTLAWDGAENSYFDFIEFRSDDPSHFYYPLNSTALHQMIMWQEIPLSKSGIIHKGEKYRIKIQTKDGAGDKDNSVALRYLPNDIMDNYQITGESIYFANEGYVAGPDTGYGLRYSDGTDRQGWSPVYYLKDANNEIIGGQVYFTDTYPKSNYEIITPPHEILVDSIAFAVGNNPTVNITYSIKDLNNGTTLVQVDKEKTHSGTRMFFIDLTTPFLLSPNKEYVIEGNGWTATVFGILGENFGDPRMSPNAPLGYKATSHITWMGTISEGNDRVGGEALFILHISPIIGHFPQGDNVLSGSKVYVAFNREVNHSAAEQAFDIYPHVTGSFSWGGANGRTMIFIPSSNLDSEMEYTVTLNIFKDGESTEDETIPYRPWNTTTQVRAPYKWTFTTSTEATQNPTASAGPDLTASLGESITFDGSSSTDDQGITSYLWDFGDSQQDTGEVVYHTYDIAGTYTVTLTVTDTNGNINSDTAIITVNDMSTLPIITGVTATSITNTSATVIWNTDKASDSLVKYGTVSGVYTADVYNAANVVSHSINLAGLTPGTTYYYVVNSTDPDGNRNDSTEYNFITETSTDDAPVLTQMNISLISTPIIIDGNLDEWTGLKSVSFKDDSGRGDAENLATVRAIWDDNNLYFAFDVTDTDLQAVKTLRDGAIWWDDSIELFIDMDHNHGTQMQTDDYHFIINLNNAIWDSKGTGSGQNADWNSILNSAVVTDGTIGDDSDSDTGYVIEMGIPWSDLGGTPISGSKIGLDLCVDDLDNGADGYQYFDWCNLTSWANPDGWGDATFIGSTNHAPALNSIGDRFVNAGSPLHFTISATDPDSDPLTYSATDLPTGASFNPTTRAFSWTPDEIQAGSYQVHFEVTDGSLSDAEDVTITVNGAAVEVTLTLHEGWNLIALPVITDSFTASSLASAIGDVSYVMKRNASDGGYQDYIVGFSGDADDFVISPDEGYYVYLDVVQKDFTISGTQPGTRSIDLTEGWNLIGWTSLDPSDAVSAFVDPLDGKIKYAAKRISPYGEYENYVAGFSDPEDNFDVEPGYGYFVFVTSDCTWTHD